MANESTCPTCGGAKAVCFAHNPVTISTPEGDFTEERRFPESPEAWKHVHAVFPEKRLKGWHLEYEYGIFLDKQGKEKKGIRFFMEKDAGASAPKPVGDDLKGKTNTELAELAVTLGITDATPDWGCGRLLSEIEGKREAVPV